MDPLRDQPQADEKPRPRRSGAGGSKKSTRRKSGSSSSSRAGASAADAGGGRARGQYEADTRRESSGNGGSGGGVAARADLGTRHDPAGAVAAVAAAQGKDSSQPTGMGSASHLRQGAKGGSRGSDRVGVGNGQDGGGSVTVQPARIRREHPPAEGGCVSDRSSMDRAILQKWRSDAVATVALGDERAKEKDPPEVEAEENGGNYDDEDFEEYSDEFDGDDLDSPPPSAKSAATATASAAITRPVSARGAGGAVVSSALKMRKTGDVQAADDKALEEIRVSLRQENMAARDRKDLRPSAKGAARAEAKPISRLGEGASRGAKGAKGSRNAAVAAAGEAPTVARGTFSVEASSADAKTSRRSSGFKMADTKALSRALAKGDPRTERVRAIRGSSRLEVESVRLFDQPPILPIDLYHRRLRGQPPLIRQAGSQTNEDARSVEAQTEDLIRADKEVQFHLGHDDTALENLMRRLRSNRRPIEQHHRPDETKEENGQQQRRTVVEGGHGVAEAGSASTTTFKGLHNANGDVKSPVQESYPASRYGTEVEDGRSGKGTGGGVAAPPPPLRLGKFLRQASVVMETLCEENVLHASARVDGRGGSSLLNLARGEDEERDDRDGRSLFSLRPQETGQGWKEVGGEGGAFGCGRGDSGSSAPVDASWEEEKRNRGDNSTGGSGDGLGVLLSGSAVVGVEFSKVKRSMLVTAHARPVGGRRRREYSGGSGSDNNGGGEVASEPAASLEGCGVVCVWNTDYINAAPVSVLSGEGLFSCLCLALHQAHVVVTGTAEGCLLLWDLREPAPIDRSVESRGLGLHCGIRPPTYTTAGGGGGGGDAGLSGPGYDHASAIVSVVPIPVAEGDGIGGGGGKGGLGGMLSLAEANSFQVASLDDRGTVSIWLASEVPKVDEGGSQTDLGLSPGGRVRLTLSKSLRPRVQSLLAAGGGVDNGGRGGRVGVVSTSHYSAPMGGLDTTTSTAADAASAAALAFSPRDPNRFLVGGSSDRVMHASRLGNPPAPKAYRPARRRLGCSLAASGVGAMGKKMDEQGGEEQEGAMGGVTCLAFSPFFQRYFLAGCGDGSIRLYKDDFAAPLRVWEGDFSVVAAPNTTSRGIGSGWPAAISSLAWSEHRPAVFFVLDSSGAMHAFDVLEDDGGPIASEPCPPAAAATIAAARGPSSASPKARPEANQAASPVPPPALALSSETLATGSRPKVALAFRGCVFTRNLAGRVFRRRQSPPVMTGLGGPAKDCSEAGSTSERERMKDWLGQVLW